MKELETIYVYDPEKLPKAKIEIQIAKRAEESGIVSEYGESIFDFDWGKDILESPEPPNVVVSDRPYVQADPTDMLQFLEAVSGSKIHYVHKGIWQNTLDRYLEHYYRLVRKKEAGQRQNPELPKILETKMTSYFDTAEGRKKPIPPVVRHTVCMSREVLENWRAQDHVVIPNAGKAYLNYACRWLFTKDGAPLQPWSLFYDGLLLRVKNKKAEKPEPITLVRDFSLCDYLDHEMLTGISLSIEITAVLLEFFDIPLRERALDAFEEHALPTVVRSREPFARISAARNFFQQILMECNTAYYHWRSSIRTGEIPDAEWEGMVSQAVRHVDLLKRRRLRLDVPERDTDRAIAHIEGLLSKVVSPVNLPEYVKNPEHGLAAFCNPKHPNTGYFLRELKKKDAMQITEIPRCRRKEHELFRDVHARVKRAIEKALEEELKSPEDKAE